MTRKQAILTAISLLEAKKGQEAAIHKLKVVLTEMPFVKWTETTVKDCVEQFMKEQGRIPAATDIATVKGMPQHPTFNYLFHSTFKEWRDRNFSSFYEPEFTIRSALKLACVVLHNQEEAAEKVFELLDEYPWTKWNEKNIRDGIETFIQEYGRLPQKTDYTREEYLPYNELFQYQFGMTRNEWIHKFCPYLIDIEAEMFRKKSFDIFLNEYYRIKPLSSRNYNNKRNKSIAFNADTIVKILGLNSWVELLETYNLPKFFPERTNRIISVETIII